MNIRTCLMTLSLSLMLPAGIPLCAVAETKEEKQLDTERQGIDQTTSADTNKVDALVKQYKVTPETVQGLRDKGQGWGEVSIGLATAEELAKKDPTTYPTINESLTKVQEMRAAGSGWGKIAKDLGFKLGPVVSASKHTRNAMRAETSGKPDTAGKPEHASKPEHAGKPDHPTKPDHAGKPDNPGKPNR